MQIWAIHTQAGSQLLKPEAELHTLPLLGRTTHSWLNNNLLHFLSPSLSKLLYTQAPHVQSGSTVLPCISVSPWEQYRVSLWVGLQRGPGWFRSDGRRKLLQEIPNCQTLTLTHTIHNLSFSFCYEQTEAPASVKKPSTRRSVSSVRLDWASNPKQTTENTALCLVQSNILRHDSLLGVTQRRVWLAARHFMASVTTKFNESAQLNNKSLQSQVSATTAQPLHPSKRWGVSHLKREKMRQHARKHTHTHTHLQTRFNRKEEKLQGCSLVVYWAWTPSFVKKV